MWQIIHYNTEPIINGSHQQVPRKDYRVSAPNLNTQTLLGGALHPCSSKIKPQVGSE